MQLTKFSHACVRLDDGNRALAIDPGVFSEIEDALDGVQAVLVTHEHVDHVEPDRVGARLDADPRLQLFAPDSVVATLGERGGQVVAVSPGQQFEAAGFTVRAFGGQHALIHPAIAMIANLGYLIDDDVYHPGDSFTVPDAAVRTLLAPTAAPWSKASEVIDFAISVRAPQVHQIHDGIVTDAWAGIVEGHLARIAGPHGVGFSHLAPRQTVTT